MLREFTYKLSEKETGPSVGSQLLPECSNARPRLVI